MVANRNSSTSYPLSKSAHARLGTSGPLVVPVSGLLIGNRGPGRLMSEVTQRYLFGFWTLMDEILNAVLFLLIGLKCSCCDLMLALDNCPY